MCVAPKGLGRVRDRADRAVGDVAPGPSYEDDVEVGDVEYSFPDSSVVHQDRWRSKLTDTGRYEPVHLCRLADIGLHDMGPASGFDNGIYRRLSCRCVVAVVNENVGTALSQSDRNRSAHTS